MRFNEQVLLFESVGNSPQVHARNIVAVEITQGVEGDAVELYIDTEDDTFLVEYGELVELEIEDSYVYAVRTAGNGPITLILYQE